MPYRRAFLLVATLGVIFSTFARDASPSQEQGRVAITPRETVARPKRSDSSLRSDVKVVLIPVTVTDVRDRPVMTLPRDTFRLLEDGVEQKIISVSQEEGPVSLGLVFDSSGSMKSRIDSSIQALDLLFKTVIPGDEFFVTQFATQARLLGGFTTDPAEVRRRLGFVEARGWTALLDAVALSAHQMRSARNQRRVLLILSDGNDNNSRFTAPEVRSIVIEANLRIYGIGVLHSPRLLQQLAQETGGNVLVAKNLAELPDIVERLSREIRSQYLLGYSPTNPINDGKFRNVKIQLMPTPGTPPLRHTWRRGYFAPEQ